MLVSLGVPDKVPAAEDVPNVNKFVFVVLIIPEVMFNVPLTDNGVFKVTPVVFVLLTIKFVKVIPLFLKVGVIGIDFILIYIIFTSLIKNKSK